MNTDTPSPCWMEDRSDGPRIAIFYHCLFVLGEPPQVLPGAEGIVREQMDELIDSGLVCEASEMHVGINGGPESVEFAQRTMPQGVQVTYHGLAARSENLTILMLEEWVKTHPGWYVLYLHSKAATQSFQTVLGKQGTHWRHGMMEDLVSHWRQCVADLKSGYDIVTSHWLWGAADGTQHIPAGNFLWVKSDFARQLPSLRLRARIQQDGAGALSSRHEAEVYWGNGPRPQVKSYQPDWCPWNGMLKRAKVTHVNVT